jgi:hypothetical protein
MTNEDMVEYAYDHVSFSSERVIIVECEATSISIRNG